MQNFRVPGYLVESRLDSALEGSQTNPPSREDGLRIVMLDGVRVSLETSTQPIGEPAFHPTVKPGRRLLSIRVIASNSTETTICGLSKLPALSVSGETGIRERPLRFRVDAPGVTGWGLAHYRTAEEARLTSASVRPGGAFTYVETYDLASADHYRLTLEIAPDRVARFDLP